MQKRYNLSKTYKMGLIHLWETVEISSLVVKNKESQYQGLY